MKAAIGLALVLMGCGPGGGGKARFSILNEGSGEAVVSTVNRELGSSFSFALLENGTFRALGPDSSYTRRITLDQGPEVVVYSTPDEDVYIESASDGEFVWGGNTGLLAAPQLTIKLPLKQDLEWETRDEKERPFYHFRVETIEAIDVPAGTFQAARVLQTNLKLGTSVTRWYADEVGLVQRDNSVLLRFQLNRSPR